MMERSPMKPPSQKSQPDSAQPQGLEKPEETSTSTSSFLEEEVVNPPLPNEQPPPLPDKAPPLPQEALPTEPPDDGWEPVWDDRAQAFYFFNRFTSKTQWENPRIPDAAQAVAGAPGTSNRDINSNSSEKPRSTITGYNPAIHGDYDPTADYAKVTSDPLSYTGDGSVPPGTEGGPTDPYAATGAFNRFTGKWQNAELTADRFSDEQKSKRQMNAFFDVDAAANSHDGRSLRAERANKKLSKHELKAFKDKRREKKEEKRRAWLRD